MVSASGLSAPGSIHGWGMCYVIKQDTKERKSLFEKEL